MKKTSQNNINLALEYMDNVLSGRRKAGKLEILAVKRHMNDLEKGPEKGIYFDSRAARKAFAFFSLLKHSKGKFAGQPFDLSGWEAFILYSIFGWKRSDGSRRFRNAYVEIARKNGKTTFAAAISLLMMIFDGEEGAEIYTAGTKREQAKICWNEAKNMILKSTALKKYVDVYQRSLVMESTLSKMEPLARDSDKLDGLNPHFAVIDEYHAWKTDDLYHVIKTATGARSQPLVFIITTAGLDKTNPCFTDRKYYIDILLGVKTQEDTFIIIFTFDDGDSWKDPENWGKSNPNLDISVSSQFMEDEFKTAINKGGTKETHFKTKNLNLWVDAPTSWIQDEKIMRCNYGTTIEQLYRKECYAGLDLASHVDINALALYFPEMEIPAVKMFFWIPEAKMLQQADKVDYKKWYNEGRIMVTPGDVIDIDGMVEDLDRILKKFQVENIAFDPAKAYHGIIQGLQRKGWDQILDEFSQSMKNMSEPTKTLEALVTSSKVDLMEDPILRWMFRNAVIIKDANDNIKLDKKKSQNKIDGLVAIVDAIGGYMSGEKIQPYENHEIRTVENF